MSNPSARELAQLLMSGFDPASELSLVKELTAVLRTKLGQGTFESQTNAINMEDAVLRYLLSCEPESLPFRIRGNRLIGKARTGKIDNEDTIIAKMVQGLTSPLLEALVRLSPDEFEIVSAASLLLNGASEMTALCTGDEGGIDFYGRIEVRPSSERVPKGVIYTTILPNKLLVLGQSKCYSLARTIGRDDIQKFKAQFLDCLNKYEGNARPPTHRVPSSYYTRGEPALGVFMTTTEFTDGAKTCAEGYGCVLISGQRLAQFLCFKRVGIVAQNGGYFFEAQVFREWVSRQAQIVRAAASNLAVPATVSLQRG